MNLNKCSRCGCFFASTTDVCPKCESKDENDKERNKIEEKKADIEWAQLFDNNPRNNEINFGK